MNGPMGGPPMFGAKDQNKLPPPKSLKEVPGYLKKLTSTFFKRLFYIFGLVWETGPWILFVMIFMAVFNGIMPVLGATVTAMILNSLVGAFNTLPVGGMTLTEQFTAMWENQACRDIVFWLCMQLAHTFVNSLVSNINTILTRIYGETVVNHIKVKIMHKAKDVDVASFDMPEFYEKLENANREAGMRPIQILNATFGVVGTVISMVSFIVVLWAVSPLAPALIAVLSIPSAVVNFIYRKKHVMYVRHRSKDRRQLNYYSGLMTNKDMVKEIRMFGLSDTFIDRYNQTFKRYFRGLKRLFIGEGAWHIGLTVLRASANCALFAYIALQVCNGSQEIGNYSLYVAALNSIANGVGSLISTTATIYEGTLFIDNMISFMNTEKTVCPSIPHPLSVSRHCGHTLQFENVSFRYPGTERDVIKNISVTINPGDTVVLVGLNGAGKTTLIKLLTRLYDPTEGRILLDGRDIKEYDVEELYRIFGIIFQDFGKYAVSVTENIAFGEIEKDIVDEEIHRAAEESNADVFIDKLPDGYNTPLMRYFEDNGIELSIGQWQKLSIARAFYSDSDILILDEPTASLDPMAEQEIFNQFDALRKDKTTIFVSHRLSSATTANKIMVLEYGELIETGSHAELMAKRGRYYELFSTQAKRYISSVDQISPEDGGRDFEATDEPRRHRGADRCPEEALDGGFRPGGRPDAPRDGGFRPGGPTDNDPKTEN
ncbi:MAG: ABC transporter ATP-binding protein [Clostridia bacterium]|nr:ABC transporter ATP-binding protein [Clostridia bacterium]